jgi:glycosyltransferase involved in cell wall biosynthesis
MKVLFDDQIYQLQKFGGINRYFDELMKISGNGIEVEVADSKPAPEVKHVNYSLYTKGLRLINRKLNLAKNHNLPPIKKNPFQAHSFDIFHPTYFDPYFLDYIQKPFVLTVYDMINEIFAEYLGPSNPVSYHKRMLCEKADQIISISETTKHDLVDIFKVPEEKVHAIPLASSFENVQPHQPANTIDLKNYILFVGSRDAYKNFYFPAIALSEILRNDKELFLVCTGHEFSTKDLELFKNLEIENQVKHVYLKNDNELAWAYQHARLFIFPSLYEGFGLPLLEAFSMDCPVISSKGGSLQEVGGDAALYFNPKNLKEIQDVAYKALYDEQVRNELIAKGRHQLKKFSWDTCRAKTVDVYKSLANN